MLKSEHTCLHRSINHYLKFQKSSRNVKFFTSLRQIHLAAKSDPNRYVVILCYRALSKLVLILMHFCGMNINMFDSKMLLQTPLRCYRKYGICIIFLSKIPTILNSETHLAQRVWMKDYVPVLRYQFL